MESNLRVKSIQLTEKLDTIQLDSLSIIPSTFLIKNKEVSSLSYKIETAQSLFIELTPIEHESIDIQYRVYPFSFAEKKRGVEVYKMSSKDSLDAEFYSIVKEEKETFEFGSLDIQGGLGRELNFGNSQNLVVNSNLNLRLSGELASGVNVVGVLTDDNLPFQPQGNSRQIREFDKVFLQFSKDSHAITLGDYEQRKPESYFLNFNKRLQGINYTGQFQQDKEWKADTNVSGAVSRGKYTQNQFVGQEGNQGPYKLFGANNESFIIILAGTERVYIDGELMERGQDRDYVIDYNVGEINFTSTRFITNRSRISVEFEYSNQIYNSTFLNAETNYGNDNLNFRLNIYTEQDSRNKANLGDTTINTGNLFENLGDSVDDFFVDSFREIEGDDERVLYRMAVDTVINSIAYDTIFIASVNQAEQLFSVNFTFVGSNQGNYSISSQLVNGRVYEFSPPNNGSPTGSYVAKLKIVPPRSQQMVTLTSNFKMSDSQSISVESSFSNKDINSLSLIGDDDNQGFANRVVWKSNYNLSKDSLKNLFTSEVNYEFKGATFRPVERYRPVEFTRDWNLNQNKSDSLGEHYGNVILNFKPNKKQTVGYNFSTFMQNENYDGFKHLATYKLKDKGYNVDLKFDYLTASEQVISSSFFRPSYSVSKELTKLNGIKLGMNGKRNRREFLNTETDILQNKSIGDSDFRFFVETQDTSKIYTKISAGKHYDQTPFQKELVDLFEANVIEAEGRLNKIRNQQLSWNLTYRDLVVLDSTLTDQSDKVSFLGKMNYSGTFFKGLLRTGFNYEVGAGQEPRREFNYVKVAQGEGQYTWNDYNGNELKEISEFEIAPFSDQAEYVRVFTASNEYVNANVTRMNQFLNLEPARIWRNEKGVKGIVSKLSINSTLGLDRKVFETSGLSQFNPYIIEVDDETLLSAINRITNRLIYNKLSNKFRVTYLQENRTSKNLLFSGFEDRSLSENKITTDLYFKNKMSLQTEFSSGNQAFQSQNYEQKNFDFSKLEVKPRLGWVVTNQLRLGLEYNFSNSENDPIFGGEKSLSNAFNIDFAWNKQSQFSLKGKFNYNDINFTGETNSAVKFSMLNGLQEGNNMIWNLNIERDVAKSVKVNLVYDGRQLGDFTPVHTGRARITAIFN